MAVTESTIFPDSMVYSYLTISDMTEYLFYKIGEVLIIIAAFVLLMCNLLGFSIYLLYMRKDEANKDRLLNVLYANLSVCYQLGMVALFVRFLLLETLGDIDTPSVCLLVRWRFVIGLFTTLLFLQISVVTSINHYNPGLYLHLSLHWRRIPVLCFQFLLVLLVLGLIEYLGGVGGVCMLEETKRNIVRFVCPLMLLNLLLQLGVVVDSYWGWRRVWRLVTVVTPCGSTNIVTPESGVELGDHLQPNTNLPITDKDHVSITAGFVTYTASLLMGVVQTIMFLNFGGRNMFYVLQLLIHSFIPVFWVHKNEKMKKYVKKKIFH